MAYTIKFLGNSSNKRDFILFNLQERLVKDGRFRATLTPSTSSDGKDLTIIVKPVGLVKAKPYCGNHPGLCLISNKPKPKATYLEWDDWVKFHKLVNTVLNKHRINANVYSTPLDVRGKMWIRKGTKARLKYEWEEHVDNFGRIIRAWNQGTEDQFVK